jgi:putative flippase GtrA
LFDRLRSLAHEAAKFGVIGGTGFLIDVGVFNLLRYAGDPGLLEHKPLTAKGIYLGNRHWTWRDRERSGARREATLFFLLNGFGMLIAVGCLAFSHYLLDLRSPLADNISANGFGLLFGMLFRFWSYRTFVFKRPGVSEPADGYPALVD